jgi:glycosyltransferase involved in cell wall biosynthesis
MRLYGDHHVRVYTDNVLHFGNSHLADGGISSVIRRHLSRDLRDTVISAVATYDPRERSPLRRNLPWVGAMRVLLANNKIDVAHVHISNGGSLLREGLVLIAARLTRRRTVVTLHGSGISKAKPSVVFFYKKLLCSAHVVHGYSDQYRQQLNIPGRKWFTIPNDVDVPSRVDFLKKEKRIIFVGEVGLRKGIDLLISAWRTLPSSDWQLLLVGSATDEGAPIVNSVSLPSSVVFAGPQSHSAVLDLYRDAAVAVLPSRAEAFPMTVCEAMAGGCAVIGSDAGALGELLTSSSQMVVRPLSSESLANALSFMMQDFATTLDYGSQARRYAVAHLSGVAVQPRWIEAYGMTLVYSSECKDGQ